VTTKHRFASGTSHCSLRAPGLAGSVDQKRTEWKVYTCDTMRSICCGLRRGFRFQVCNWCELKFEAQLRRVWTQSWAWEGANQERYWKRLDEWRVFGRNAADLEQHAKNWQNRCLSQVLTNGRTLRLVITTKGELFITLDDIFLQVEWTNLPLQPVEMDERSMLAVDYFHTPSRMLQIYRSRW